MKLMIALLAMSVSLGAFADGFVCTTSTVKSAKKGDINIKIYNHTDPSQGTRGAHVLVISDPTVNAGRKTIAKFEDTHLYNTGTLVNSGARYTANVDSRVNGVDRGGENILGTKLSELKTINLDLAFSYARPVADGAKVGGKLVMEFEKAGRKPIIRFVDCTRYLKGE